MVNLKLTLEPQRIFYNIDPRLLAREKRMEVGEPSFGPVFLPKFAFY